MVLRGLRAIGRLVSRPRKQRGLEGSVSKSPVSTAAVQTLCANMQLRLSERRPPVVAVAAGGCGGGSLQQQVGAPPLAGPWAEEAPPAGHRGVSSSSSGGRDNPLTVVLAWMNARDKHLQRYHDLYLGLGFDVLTVRTLPLQLAFPASGAQVVARKLLEFLLSHPNYSRLVVHGFSVGGYQFGEVLVQMRKQQDRYAALLPRFKAQVYDSAVDYGGIVRGFPAALTSSRVLRKVLEWAILVQRALLYPVSTVHWKASSQAFHQNPLTCPTLMISSELDQVGSVADNLRVANAWRQRGTDVRFCVFPDSRHVQHMGRYPERYSDEVLRLLRRAQLIP